MNHENLNWPKLGLGMLALSGADSSRLGYGAMDESEALAVLQSAYQEGTRLFDVADVFGDGQGEVLLAKAIKQFGWNSDELIISTKGGLHGFNKQDTRDLKRQAVTATELRASLEASLTRLGVGCVDLYCLHHPTMEAIQEGSIFEVLATLKAEGKIKQAGVAIREPQEGIQSLGHDAVDVIQAPFNFFNRTASTSGLMQVCADKGKHLMLHEVLGKGFLSGGFDVNRALDKSDSRSVWPKPLIQKRIEAGKQLEQFIPDTYPSLGAFALQYAKQTLDSIEGLQSTLLVGARSTDQWQSVANALTLAPIPQSNLDALHAHLDQLFALR